MRTVALAGQEVPQLGQGTWTMGDQQKNRGSEIAALRRGLDLGLKVIDTAEMYGDGRSEELVGTAIEGRRNDVFLVSKVLPSHASAEGTLKACEASLRRLGVDALDLYLLHWRGRFALQETVAAFQQLRHEGKIKAWGVSNFDVSDMEELMHIKGGSSCAANQVLYNPEHRGIEFDLLPWCDQHNVTVMAYSPVGQGGSLLKNKSLVSIANSRNVSVARIALAWCMRKPVVAIPKAGSVEHVIENAEAADIDLNLEELAAIDKTFAPPSTKQLLESL